MDAFDMRIKIIDDGIKNLVDINITQEKLKRQEEQIKALNVNINKKQKKKVSLSDKFSSLNLKAKQTIENISKSLKTQNDYDFKEISRTTRYYDGMTNRKHQSMRKLIIDSSKFYK